MNKVFKKVIIFFLLIILPIFASAEMRSDTYVIHESVMHVFDGPIISNVSCSPGSTTATCTWTTDIPSDSFVVFSTDSNFTNSKEQGKSSKIYTSHSVEISGLSPSTVYYYYARSTRVNGGVTNSNTYSFTTGAEIVTTVSTSGGGGGGILIIDKTDKFEPLISDILVTDVSYSSAKITWATDEEATSFVEYGYGTDYNNIAGDWGESDEHEVVLDDLIPDTVYNFRVISGDSWGNIASSTNQNFATLSLTDDQEVLSEEDLLNMDEESILERMRLLERLASVIPGPVVTEGPRVVVYSDRATITWGTDKRTNSVVAFATEGEYDPQREEPYQQIVGDFENYTNQHSVEIMNLSPSTLYNYQLRIKPVVGQTNNSDNYTFTTSEEGLEIKNYFIDVLENDALRFRWVTNNNADSAVRYAPYRNGVLQVEESITTRDNDLSVIHDLTVDNILSGIFYDFEIISRDEQGRMAIEQIERFSTGEDATSPQILRVQTNSTIFLDKEDKVQTIISWFTDEPATSRVYYLEGVHTIKEEWPVSTGLKTSYSKEHVEIMNEFKPGTVYSFRVESTDSSGNSTLSKVYTFLTPKKKQSIFQLIMSIFENLFGWMFRN